MTMITATATRQGTTTIMTMAAACYVLRSNRTDLRAEYLDPFAGIEKIRLRGGLTDYQHQEIEGGEVGTTFKNRGYDLRLEAQQTIAGWRGVVGMQTSHSDFRADGEAFLPRSKTRANGIFLLEEYKLADWRFELGARQDWQTVSPRAARRAATCRAPRCRRRPSGTSRRSIRPHCRCRARSACRPRRSFTPRACTWPPTPMRSATPAWAARPRTTST